MSQSDAQKKTLADRIEDAILATLERIFPGHLARMTRNKAYTMAAWLAEIELRELQKLLPAIKVAKDYDDPSVQPDIWLAIGNPALDRFADAVFSHSVESAVSREVWVLKNYIEAIAKRNKMETVRFLRQKEQLVGQRLGRYEGKGIETRDTLLEFQKALQDIRDAITALEFDEVPAGQFLSA